MGRNKNYDRQNVLNQAMSLFWRNGYLATSMADMVQVTGLNTASMYKEFGDKDGLFEEALAYYRGHVMSPRFKILAESSNMEGIEAFLKSVVSGAAREDYKGCLIMNHMTQKHVISPNAAELVDDFCASLEGLLETALRNAQAAGDLASDKDPAVLASYIMCCVHGLRLYGRHQREKDHIPKLYDTILQALRA